MSNLKYNVWHNSVVITNEKHYFGFFLSWFFHKVLPFLLLSMLPSTLWVSYLRISRTISELIFVPLGSVHNVVDLSLPYFWFLAISNYLGTKYRINLFLYVSSFSSSRFMRKNEFDFRMLKNVEDSIKLSSCSAKNDVFKYKLAELKYWDCLFVGTKKQSKLNRSV